MLPARNYDIRWLLRSVCACLSWHQDGTLCFLQVSSQGMEQHSRPRRDGGAHHSKPWPYTEKAQEKTATITNTKNAAPFADDTPKRERNVESHSPKEVSVTPEALAKLQLKRDIQKAHDELEVFINQVQIDRKQMNEAKVDREARKLEAILKYTRYTLMPHGFTDEELYQIEEAVKLLVELNGVTRMEVLSISKKKGLKQADLKNFCWNVANQYGIDPKTTALFALNLFYAWFSNTEPSSIQKTLRNTAGSYTIEIDANIIDHLPQLEEKVLGKNHQ